LIARVLVRPRFGFGDGVLLHHLEPRRRASEDHQLAIIFETEHQIAGLDDGGVAGLTQNSLIRRVSDRSLTDN
jgi:hypothetical protein